MLRLIVLFTVFYFAQSKTDECFNATECESNPPLKITKNPKTSVLLVKAGDRVSLVCEVTTDSSATIYWLRNNSDGHSIKLNSTLIFKLFGPWIASLKDVPPAGKYPYKYQCVATLKCCTVRSSPSTVTVSPPRTTPPPLTVPGKNGSSLTLSTNMKLLHIYPGHGQVKVVCNGQGDNATSVYWIRTDSKNTTLILNSTELKFLDISGLKIWQAELEERPPKDKFPYTYQCVVSNKCCNTRKSPLIKVILVDTTGQGCQFFRVSIFKSFKAFPRNRSMEIVWDYDKDTTDTGFRLKWNKDRSSNSSTIELDINTRRYVVNNLVPSTRYQLSLLVRYGDNCSALPSIIFKNTLLDFPGKPIDLTATAVNATAIKVTWSPPKISYGHLLGYIVFWRQNNTGEDYQATFRNISNQPARLHVITNLKQETNYEITVLAINALGNGSRANPVHVSTQRKPTPPKPTPPKPTLTLSRNLKLSHTYPGHGQVEVECNGLGDNATSVYWIRTDSKNTTLILNSTELKFHDIGGLKLWQAELEERPPKDKFPYTYQCVVSNKCCNTLKSPLIKVILVDTTGQGCQFRVAFLKSFKAIPRKRSMEIVWDYDKETTDTGFRLKWNKDRSSNSSTIELDINTRRYVVNNLVPSTRYQLSLVVRYGDNCSAIPSSIFKNTLLDFPGKPIDLTATAVNATAIKVTWSPPKISYGHLLGYIVFWRQNNTGEDYQATFRNTSNQPARLHVITNLKQETNYEITVLAINALGNGSRANPVHVSTQRKPPQPKPTEPKSTRPKSTRPNSTPPKPSQPKPTQPKSTEPKPTVKAGTGDSDAGVIAGSVIAVIFLIILVLIGLYIFRKRLMQRRRKESVKSFHAMHGVAHNNSFVSEPQQENYPPPTPQPLPDKGDLDEDAAVSYIVLLDDWEILRENLKILEKKLGGGQFGIVKQGLYKTDKNESEIVAVKMLKPGAGESDRSDLLTELQILKEVNKMPHPNVLKLIGACSAAEPILVVTEFCSGGNLRRFLINSRVDSSDESSSYINLSSALTHRQLLRIAVDVTSGMIHLASYKFVHRDLAARNVLIGDDNTAKLSDFGLARDIRGAEEYIRANQNLLPVKWMALESLLEGRFTTASDIWSFGVLLYEITTLGEEPYRGISPYNIVNHVGSGCRMAKPRHCSEEVYTIMRNCWKVDPEERPTFEELNEALYAMLTDDENSYINITQVIDEGPLLSPTHGNNMSFKDASVRYTTA